MPFYSGYYGYSNPYWLPSYGYGLFGCNYAQPITLVSYQNSSYLSSGFSPSTADDAGLAEFDAAVAAFQYGDYQGALDRINQAVGLRPGDPLVHEFRALVLFALGRYDEAAAGLNALLAVAPGWDWATMIGLYDNRSDIYVPHLRRLEQFVSTYPDDTGARFVLAYHYLVIRSTDAAVRQLQEVVRQQPGDQVAAQLLNALINPPADGALPAPQEGPSVQPQSLNPSPAEPTPAPQTLSAPETPGVDPSAVAPAPSAPARISDEENPAGPTTDLVGKWVAQRENGQSFTLTIDESSAFSWAVTGGPQAAPTEPLTGNYELEGSLLVLGSPDGDVMIGRLTPISADEFQFVLVGGPPNDPGLRFKRQK